MRNGVPRLNLLRSSSSKNLTGQAVFSVQSSEFGGPVFAFQATTDKPTGQVEVGEKEARGKKVSPPLESANKKMRRSEEQKIEIRK